MNEKPYLERERPFEWPLTIREAFVRATAWLTDQGVEEAKSNAELLLLHVLGIERAELLLVWEEPFPESKRAEWEGKTTRKASGEPLQYMIGEQWFCGRPFRVTPAVLIPRPETELLAEAVLLAADRAWPGGAEQALSAVDVGTGSGALAVTLAAQRPAWRIGASDLSEDALRIARANAARHNVAERIVFAQGDLLAPFLGLQGGKGVAGEDGMRDDESRSSGQERENRVWNIDILVSNPPYIPAGELPSLQREVRDYEPRLALDGGTDGLTLYRRMLEQLRQLPAMPRIVAFELGIGQPVIVRELLRDMGAWDSIEMIADYNGIDRHLVALRTDGRDGRDGN